MSNYEFTKLSEVPAVETVKDNLNVLVEQDGEIGKVAKTQIGAQADWNETDETSPAYILNKPEVGSSGGKPVFFYISNGIRKDSKNGEIASADEIVEAYFTNRGYINLTEGNILPTRITGFYISNNIARILYTTGSIVLEASTNYDYNTFYNAVNSYLEQN